MKIFLSFIFVKLHKLFMEETKKKNKMILHKKKENLKRRKKNQEKIHNYKILNIFIYLE